MNRLEKLVRADRTRPTRFHTSRGTLCLNVGDMALAFATTLLRRGFGKRVALPWIPLPAVRFLRPRAAGATVFEYSVGMSTLWYARRCARLCAVEDDEGWLEAVRSRLRDADRVMLLFARDRAGYVRAIERGSPDGYDVISIDGSHRRECLDAAIPHLRPGGVLVLDNTDVPPLVDCSPILHDRFAPEDVHLFPGFAVGHFHPTECTICVNSPASVAWRARQRADRRCS